MNLASLNKQACRARSAKSTPMVGTHTNPARQTSSQNFSRSRAADHEDRARGVFRLVRVAALGEPAGAKAPTHFVARWLWWDPCQRRGKARGRHFSQTAGCDGSDRAASWSHDGDIGNRNHDGGAMDATMRRTKTMDNTTQTRWCYASNQGHGCFNDTITKTTRA